MAIKRGKKLPNKGFYLILIGLIFVAIIISFFITKEGFTGKVIKSFRSILPYSSTMIASPTPKSSVTPSPSPSPSPVEGCCDIQCEDSSAKTLPPIPPPTYHYRTCKQTTESSCNIDTCNKECGSMGKVCGGFTWDANSKCIESEDGTSKLCYPIGCCQYKENGKWVCEEGVTEEDCTDKNGAWDTSCQICDKITNTCRDKLCCQLSIAGKLYCKQVKQPTECKDIGGKPSRGECDQRIGRCDLTGCCELPGTYQRRCSGPVTQDECKNAGGKWNWQGKCNTKTGMCSKLGCCQEVAEGSSACTQVPQDECSYNWIENAECNYGTGSCETNKNRIKITVDIKPDVEPNLHPTTQEDLYCYIRVEGENLKDYGVKVSITGTHGKPFMYQSSICTDSTGISACTTTIKIPKESTIAGDNVFCRVSGEKLILDPTAPGGQIWDKALVEDQTNVQMCVYMENQLTPIPQENTAKPLIDLVFIPDSFKDEDNERWKKDTQSYFQAIFNKEPFSTYKYKFRTWRIDSSGDTGQGEQLDCNGGASAWLSCRTRRALEMGKWCPFDRGLIVIKDGSGMQYARPRLQLGIILSAGIQNNWQSELAVHELAHLFNLGDEYYNNELDSFKGIINLLFDWPNCYQVGSSGRVVNTNKPCGEINGGIFSNPASDGWCTGDNPDPRSDIPNDSPCKPLTPGQCRANSECILFNNLYCIDLYADYNIGKNCKPGTGCYPGCWAQGSFRSSVTSLMSYEQDKDITFNAVSKKIITDIIKCETKSSLVSCPTLPEPPDLVA